MASTFTGRRTVSGSRILAGSLLVLWACTPPAPPEEPAPSATTPTPKVRTCAIEPDIKPNIEPNIEPNIKPNIETDIQTRSLVTTRNGVRYFHGYGNQREGLIWLDENGQPGFHPMPLAGATCVAEPAGVRCFRGPVRELDGTITPLRSFAVTIDASGRISSSDVRAWTGAPWMHLESAASNSDQALLLFQQLEDKRRHHVGLWSVPTGQPQGPRLTLGRWLQPVAAQCRQQCFLVAIEDDGPRRRLVLVRGQRSLQKKRLSDEHPLSAVAVSVGERTYVMWERARDHRVRLLGLDSKGRLAMPPRDTSLRLDTRGRLQSIALPGHVAARTGDRWFLVRLGDDGLPGSPMPLDVDSVGLKTGPVGDGVVVVALTGHVDYDDAGEYHFHSWRFEARVRFFGHGTARRPSPWQSLLDGVASAGDGRGGYEVDVLTRPGRAVALLMPRGDAHGARRLIPLRGPCTGRSQGSGARPVPLSSAAE